MGTKLVGMLIGVAKEKEVETIYRIILPENRSMIGLCEKLGFSIRKQQDNVIAELKLTH